MAISDNSDNPQIRSRLRPAYAGAKHRLRAGRRLLVKAVGFTAFIIISAALILFNIVLVWVATGPRDLSKALPYFESALAGSDAAYTVKVTEGMLLWDGWRHPIDIRLRGVNIYTREGQRFAVFPDISVGVDVLSLAMGRVALDSLEVRRPVISLFQGENGEISFGFPAQEGPPAPPEPGGTALTASMAGFFEGEGPPALRKLRRLAISGADVSVGNLAQGVFLKARDVNITMQRGRRTAAFTMRADLPRAAEAAAPARVAADLKLRKGVFEGKLRVQAVQPSLFAPLFKDKGIAAALQFPVTGWADVRLSKKGELQGARYLLHAGSGIFASDMLEEPLAIQQAQIEGVLRGTSELDIDRLGIDFWNYAVQGTAQLRMTDKGPGIQARLVASGVPISHVRRFWPVALAPVSRDWVVSNIRGGHAREASLLVDIPPDAPDDLPDEAIRASVRVENTEVQALPGHPPVTGITGVVNIGVKTLEALLEKGSVYTATKATNARVYIADLTLDNPLIEVSFDADAPAADVIEFLSRPPAQHAQHLGLDKATGRGSATGHVKLGFYYFAPSGREDDMGVDYNVQVKVKDIVQPGFLGKFDVQGASGDLTVENSGLHFIGSGTGNEVPAKADVAYFFKPQEGVDTKLTVNARAPVTALPRFGYPELPFLSGMLGIEATLEQGPEVDRAKAKIDLTDATVEWPKLAWHKPAGNAATLEARSEKKDGVLHVPELSYSAPKGEKAQGRLVFGPKMDAVSEVELTGLNVEPHRLKKLFYAEIPGGFRLEATGERLDISGFMGGGEEGGEGGGEGSGGGHSFEHFPAAELSLDIEELTLGKERKLYNVSGTLQCGEHCFRADIRGNTANSQPFDFIIKSDQGGRLLSITAADTGAFLHALNIYDNMKGGGLSLTGRFDDSRATSPLQGRASVSEHKIQNAPVLTKLISLASLTGIFDTLGGEGITFKRLNAPFVLENDVITLTDVKTHGSAMGLTADGTITFPERKWDIRGTIVPSYTLNTVLGNVPILGDVITGGGEGVFGARYSIKGAGDDIDVSVNPLSMLTPGFLRGLFEVIEEPPKKEEKKEKKKDF